MFKPLFITSLLGLSLFANNNNEIKLANGNYNISTNKEKAFIFNNKKVNFVAFKIEGNVISNENFTTGFKLENNILSLYDSFNPFTNEYGKVIEEWEISNANLNVLTRNTCYNISNKKENLLLCTN